MHPTIEKLKENKSYDKDLTKLRLDALEGSRKREKSSQKKY
jgi:hypothetical protein